MMMPSYPVLPKLKLDFTTTLLDARVTFSRTTDATHPATYVDSSGIITAATDNQARFDYDPVTLTCKGLLIEESRKNSATYSSDLTNANWANNVAGSAVAATRTKNYAVAPDGTATATRLQLSLGGGTTTGSFTYLYQAAVTASTASVGTYYLKANSGTPTIYIRVGNNEYTVTLSSSWTRIERTCPSTNTSTQFGIGLRGGQSTPCSDTADISVWGAQLEAGAFATSYIPTTTAAVTRNADVATITSTNFSSWWNALEGSVLARYRPSTVSGTRPVIQFDDTTADNLICLRGNTTNPELYIKATTDQAQIDAGTIAANTVYRLAGAWKANDCAASIDTGAAVLDTSVTLPAVTQARIGCDGTNYLNGHIERIEYWPRRALNAELQVLSSLAGRQSMITPVVRNLIVA